MNASDLRALIKKAFPSIATTASEMSIDAEDHSVTSFAGLSQSLLTFANEAGEYRLNDSDDQLHKMRAVLEEVETAVNWPRTRHSGKLSTLRRISESKNPKRRIVFSLKGLQKLFSQPTIEDSLREYVSRDPELTRLLELIGEIPKTPFSLPESGEDLPVYPQEINTQLHDVLSLHMACCSCSTTRHSPRLRLKGRDKQDDNVVRFEVLFSAPTNQETSTSAIQWRETRLLIPRPKKGLRQKKVMFHDTPRPSPLQESANQHYTIIEPGKFCEVLSQRHGFRLCFQINHPDLGQLDDEELPTPNVAATQSIPLCKALMLRRMSRKDKCILAFTMAKSVWQYYDSEWMKLPWTHEDIHFLDDQDATPTQPHKPSWTCRPYLSTLFDTQAPEIPEYFDVNVTMHHYPKVLALGILLIEIANGSTLQQQNGDLRFDLKGIKDLYISGWSSLKSGLFKGEGEPVFDIYVDVVKNCLSKDLFAEAPYLEKRRKILYEKIVLPLKGILDGTGWSRALDEIKQEPLPPPAETSAVIHTVGVAPSVPESTPHQATTTRSCGNKEFHCVDEAFHEGALLSKLKTSSSDAWLESFQRFSHSVKLRTLSENPIRIAVLDTGCDMDASVFNLPGAKQSIIWKDMVDCESLPIDVDPGRHGTRIISVLLRIIPNANVYVIRIASHQEALHNSHQRIADVSIYKGIVV